MWFLFCSILFSSSGKTFTGDKLLQVSKNIIEGQTINYVYLIFSVLVLTSFVLNIATKWSSDTKNRNVTLSIAVL